jgi:hypothetical protein
VTVLRIFVTAALVIVAGLIFPPLSANSQLTWQSQLDRAVAKAFQGVKNCVARELEYGRYPCRSQKFNLAGFAR